MHPLSGTGKRAAERGPVVPRSLDADRPGDLLLACPLDQREMAVLIVGELAHLDHAAELVHRSGRERALVRVHADR
jgi:hypothetical protein